MSTLDAIREQVEALAAEIDAPAIDLPTYGRSDQSGLPHIEVSPEGVMYWVVCERGKEYQRRGTLSRDELLYWVFQSVTHTMASNWEVHHRNPDEDFRKQLFTKQFELLDRLNTEWTERRKVELGRNLNDAGL